MSVLNRLAAGAIRGAMYGLLGGILLGTAGSVVAPPIEYEKILVWTNRFGRKTRFTYLDTVSILKEDLLVIFKQRESNRDAFNEAFRNIQSAISVYHPVKVGTEPAEIMTATKMTNFVKRASKAMEAMHVEILVKDSRIQVAEDFQKSMMSIQLSLEEMINYIRLKSKNSLPNIS